MGRAFSVDLRQRVVEAIDGGISTREAARRFAIGIATAGDWYRQWRRTGDVRPCRQGPPRGLRLDAHASFILGLIEARKDITLAEIAAQLIEDRRVSACPATIWYFLDRRGITFKKRQRMPASNSASM